MADFDKRAPSSPAAVTSSIARSSAAHFVTPTNRSPVSRSAASFRFTSLVPSASVIRRVSLYGYQAGW